MTPEFSRIVRLSEIGTAARPERIAALPGELEALATRFGLASLDRLEADLTVRREAAGVRVKGRLQASGAQHCVISGEPVPEVVDERVDLLFASNTPAARPDEEVELAEGDLDVLPLEGEAVDIGEAVAQSFGLALEAYPRAPDEVLGRFRQRLMSEEEVEAQAQADKAARNPFRVLKGGGGE